MDLKFTKFKNPIPVVNKDILQVGHVIDFYGNGGFYEIIKVEDRHPNGCTCIYLNVKRIPHTGFFDFVKPYWTVQGYTKAFKGIRRIGKYEI